MKHIVSVCPVLNLCSSFIPLTGPIRLNNPTIEHVSLVPELLIKDNKILQDPRDTCEDCTE